MRLAVPFGLAVACSAVAGACGRPAVPPAPALHDGTYAASQARLTNDECALGSGWDGQVFPTVNTPDEIAIRIGNEGLAEGTVTRDHVVAGGDHLRSFAPDYDCVIEEHFGLKGTVVAPDAWDANFEVDWSYYSGTQCLEAVAAEAQQSVYLPCSTTVSFHLGRVGPMPSLSIGTAAIAAGNSAPLVTTGPAISGTGFAMTVAVDGTAGAWSGVPAGAWSCRKSGKHYQLHAKLARDGGLETGEIAIGVRESAWTVGPHPLAGSGATLSLQMRSPSGIVTRSLEAFDGTLWIDSAGTACAVHTTDARIAGSVYPLCP